MNGNSHPLKRKDLVAEIERLQAELDRQADSQRIKMNNSVGNRAWLLALDRHGRIQFASCGLAEYLAFPILVGLHWPELVYPGDQQAAGDILIRASLPELHEPITLRLLKMNGSSGMADLLPVPLNGVPGNPETAALFVVLIPPGQPEQNQKDNSFVLERISDAVIFTTKPLGQGVRSSYACPLPVGSLRMRTTGRGFELLHGVRLGLTTAAGGGRMIISGNRA